MSALPLRYIPNHFNFYIFLFWDSVLPNCPDWAEHCSVAALTSPVARLIGVHCQCAVVYNFWFLSQFNVCESYVQLEPQWKHKWPINLHVFVLHVLHMVKKYQNHERGLFCNIPFTGERNRSSGEGYPPWGLEVGSGNICVHCANNGVG